MIGPILIAASWVLLRLEGKGLGVIGFNAPRLRLRQFSVAFLAAGTVAGLQQLGYSWATATPWRLNEGLTSGLVIESLRWNTNSVLYEELLFRAGAFGFMFALAFAQTRSVAMPIGLHLGWNLVSYVVFSAGPLGAAILIPDTGVRRLQVEGVAGFLLGLAWPMALVAGVTYRLTRSRPQMARRENREPA